TSLFPGLSRNDPEELLTLGGADRLEAVRRLAPDATRGALTSTTIRDESGAGVGAVSLVRPIGGWLDPVERAGRSRPAARRALGTSGQGLGREGGQDRSAMDASGALARVLVGQARRLLPATECLLAVVTRERQDHFQVLAGGGPWAERQVGTQWPRNGTMAGR